MFAQKNNGAIALGLLTTVILWGASNCGTRFLVHDWPPDFVGASRFLCAGLLMVVVMKKTNWLGKLSPLTASDKRDLWLRGALALAAYLVAFNWALHFTGASHVALYLGMSPIWALVWDHPPTFSWRSAQRYGAAALAFSGLLVLFWPALKSANTGLLGEALALAASLCWATFGRQCRGLGARLTGAEISAHTMWRAGVLLLPFAAFEVVQRGMTWRWSLVWTQLYCIVGGGVIAYALWNNGLRHWPTSRVFIFNNLIPLSTTAWAWACLGEPVTRNYAIAMVLVVLGVILGQARWEKILGRNWLPAE